MGKRDVAVKAGNGKLFKAAKGSILLELNLVMVLLLLAAGLFQQSIGTVLQNAGKIKGDLQLTQADRYLDTFLGKQISFNSVQVVLEEDGQGKPKIACQDILGNQKVSFYTQGTVLYRRLQAGPAVGVNPLSLSQVAVNGFAVKRITSRTLWVSYRFLERQTGREKEFQHWYYLGNGEVVDVRSEKTAFW